jgi:hypothetical protein
VSTRGTSSKLQRSEFFRWRTRRGVEPEDVCVVAPPARVETPFFASLRSGPEVGKGDLEPGSPDTIWQGVGAFFAGDGKMELPGAIPGFVFDETFFVGRVNGIVARIVARIRRDSWRSGRFSLLRSAVRGRARRTLARRSRYPVRACRGPRGA